MRFYKDSLTILFSFLLVFVWQNSSFAPYSVPFVGFLVFLFLLVSIKNKANFNLGGAVNFFILNTVLFLFIFSTGGVNSSLFFLVYFLLFAAAFIMQPKSVFLFPAGVIILFWTQIFEANLSANLIKVASLVFLSPLAYFFGIQFGKNLKHEDEDIKTKERVKEAADEIAKDVEEVIEEGKEKLDSKEVSKLDEILEETEDLRSEK